jgi:hypothetical protein
VISSLSAASSFRIAAGRLCQRFSLITMLPTTEPKFSPIVAPLDSLWMSYGASQVIGNSTPSMVPHDNAS